MRRSTRGRLFFLVAMAVTVTTHAWKPKVDEPPEPVEGLEYVDGTPFDLAQLTGRPTVLYFGADWCPPCVEKGRPATLKVATKYQPMGLKVVLVQMDDNRFRQKKIDESAELGLKIVMPRTDVCPPGKCPSGVRDLGRFGYIYRFPTAIVLDDKGIVRAKIESGQEVVRSLDAEVGKVTKAAP